MRIAFFHSLGLENGRILGRALSIGQFHHRVFLHPRSRNLVWLVKEPEQQECILQILLTRHLHDMVLGRLICILIQDECFPNIGTVVHHARPPGISWMLESLNCL